MDFETAFEFCVDEYGVLAEQYALTPEDDFFTCPECGEPIYRCDYGKENLIRCPICGFNFKTGEDESEMI